MPSTPPRDVTFMRPCCRSSGVAASQTQYDSVVPSERATSMTTAEKPSGTAAEVVGPEGGDVVSGGTNDWTLGLLPAESLAHPPSSATTAATRIQRIGPR